MGKDLKGKKLGVGISQRSDEFYVGRFDSQGSLEKLVRNQSHEIRKTYKIKEKPKEIKII